MPGPEPIRYATLHESALVCVRDYVCRAAAGGPSAEEEHPRNAIVLMRHGAFRKHFGKRSVVADVNRAVFFSKGSTPRVSHPADCGDRGTVFVVRPETLHEIVRELDPSVDGRPDQPFPFAAGPCDPSTFVRHRNFVRRLGSAAGAADPLWAETEALGLCADVLAAAFAHAGLRTEVRKDATTLDHAERVEAARAFLARDLGARVTLDEVARAAALSPFHFSRVFRQHTGLPVHRYLMQLRLRAALDRLAEGERDLTALGVELGFSSHAHFTETFRRAFGMTPSAYRRAPVAPANSQESDSRDFARGPTIFRMKKTSANATLPAKRTRRAAIGSLLALPLAARATPQTKPAPAPTNGADGAHADLLAVREGVWRSWFGGDRKALLAILPADFVGIGSGDGAIRNRDEAIADSEGFAQAGNRLTDLRFSENRIQSIGSVRVIYGRYSFTFTDKVGKANTVAGRLTEVFVREGRRWSHPGWHLDSGR